MTSNYKKLFCFKLVDVFLLQYKRYVAQIGHSIEKDAYPLKTPDDYLM